MDEAYRTEVQGRTTSALALVKQAHTELDDQLEFLKSEAERVYIEAGLVGKTYSAKERHWIFLTKPRKQRTMKHPEYQRTAAE